MRLSPASISSVISYASLAVGFKLWAVHKLRDGRINRTQWFNERSEALEAAGLRE
ncbi:MAG: hypothetical protein WA701_05630 [Solirubrobacterales bacterium]